MAKYQIQEKLLHFEKINANFVENVSGKIGMIRFDPTRKSRKKKKPAKIIYSARE